MYSNGCVQRRSLGESILISHADDETSRVETRRDSVVRQCSRRTCERLLLLERQPCVSVPGPNSQDVIGYQLATQRLDIAVRQQGTPCAPPWWYDEAHERRALASVFSMPSNAPSVVSRQSVTSKASGCKSFRCPHTKSDGNSSLNVSS